MLKTTIVTFGSIALETERAKLAKTGSFGGQAIAFEHMVERLAGGFLRMVDIMTLREVVALCLPETFIGELETIKSRPGMTSACSKSLMAWWMSGLKKEDYADVPRLHSLFLLEKAVEEKLPAHMRKPADLVEIAISKIAFVPKLFGEISFRGMTDLHPVWRPVLEAMTKLENYSFKWDSGALPKPEFLTAFPEHSYKVISQEPYVPSLSAFTCSDARHEVVESLRWVVELLDQGVKAEDIAIAAVTSGPYEAFFEAEMRASELDVYRAHGAPILMTQEGQECAALADILIRGVSHKRIRRLAEVGKNNEFFVDLSKDLLERLPADASLKTLERWQNLLNRNDMKDINEILLKTIELLFEGVSVALKAGETVLSKDAFKIWEYALKMAPASALDVTLKNMRTRPFGTSLTNVCFMAARDLVAAPRKHVRLVGMTSRQWPRRDGEDSLIPSYIVPRKLLSPMSISEVDKRDFHSILSSTEKEVVFSWARMDGDGREQRPSTLVPEHCVQTATFLDSSRKTRYPTCETDRLFMRAVEFSKTPEAERAKIASLNWSRPFLTPHDGLLSPDHPQIESVFQQVQSPTSLQKMIRDPIGFVWKYALGFNAPEYEDEPLLVDARTFGNIVHEILKSAIEKLNRHAGGFASAPEDVLRREVHKARLDVGVWMEQRRPIPPILIWSQTLDRAETMALKALSFDYGEMDGMKTYAEIPFGGKSEWIREDLPWTEDKDVFIPGTSLKVQGVIDRLDIDADGVKARVLDYKTGKTPTKADTIGIAGGAELQRAIYKYAVETLMEGVAEIESALYYPITDTYMPMSDIEQHVAEVSGAVKVAMQVLRSGYAYPGIGAAEAFNDMMFAFPARAKNVYLENKQALIGEEFEALRKVWDTK